MNFKNENDGNLIPKVSHSEGNERDDNNSNYPIYLYQPSIITYVTDTSEVPTDSDRAKKPVFVWDSSTSDENFDKYFYDIYPQFLTDVNCIVVPKKVKRHLEREIPLSLLHKVDKDKNVAIEKCLIVASNLTSTIFSDEKWKSLSSTLLNEQIKRGRDNTFLYKHALNVLTYTSKYSNPVIEVKKNVFDKESYQQGVSSKVFKLNSSFSEYGTINYYLTDNNCLQKRRKYIYSKLKKAKENSIANNLLNLYPSIELPSMDEMFLEAKRLIKINYKTKKGKQVTFLNKRKKEYYPNHKARSFVEDNLKQYEYLTQRGFMIPIIGNDRSGGRVVDSFNLMPSWIRKLIKIDGENIAEVDFKALHPNIAMSLYGGTKKFLTHQQIALESGIDVSRVKIEHLSFFNKRVRHMKKCALYNYYLTNEPDMMFNIVNDKYKSKDSYKITSKRMFKKEVEIVTECINEINKKGIYVGYVYDALFCKGSDVDTVKKIMDEVILKFKVYTTASL